MAQDAPQTITLPVPRAYRDYIARKPNGQHLAAIASGALIVAVGFFGFRSAHIDFAALLAIPIGIVGWIVELRRPWRYRIDSQGISIVRLTRDDRSWSWARLEWKSTQVLTIEEGTWADLPALRFSVLEKGK